MTYDFCYKCCEKGVINRNDLVHVEDSRGRLYPLCKKHAGDI